MDTKLLFTAAKEAGLNEIEVYRLKTVSSNISVFNHEVDDMKSSSSDVCYIRGSYNGHLGAVYLENNNMSVEEVISIIKENASLININEPYFIYPGDESYPELKPFEGDFVEHTMAEKTALCLDLANLIEAEHEWVDSCPSASYSESYTEVSIVNSSGLNVSKKNGHAVLVAQAVVKHNGEVKSGYEVQLAKKFSDFDTLALAKKVVSDTVSEIGGEPLPSGNYRVVVKNSVIKSLLGAFSNVFSAEALIRKMSFLDGKLDTKVFGDNITIVDDPLCELAPDQDSFDDEGVSAKKKVVVENGVFKTFLHNLKTAKMLGTETTGNGYKAGVSAGVGVSPSNFYIEPGNHSFDELVAECGNGFLLTDVAGLHAGINVINGDFSLQSSGFEIKDGKVGKAVNLIVTSGNIKTLLNEVELIGSDLEFKTSNIGAPSLLVKNISISGK